VKNRSLKRKAFFINKSQNENNHDEKYASRLEKDPQETEGNRA
jgi:hypothetical protein